MQEGSSGFVIRIPQGFQGRKEAHGIENPIDVKCRIDQKGGIENLVPYITSSISLYGPSGKWKKASRGIREMSCGVIRVTACFGLSIQVGHECLTIKQR